MIVRKYTRRARCGGRSCSDADGGGAASLAAAGFDEPESSQDPFSLSAFSSQDSSSWSLDPDPSAPLSFDDLPGPSRPRKRPRMPPARSSGTATLMEAQEFGEMMEHVDEVNFALDGLRQDQQSRIRRASLLSLLTICGTAQKRRLLRAQGIAKRIVDSILDLSFDDSSSTLAASALFYVLASDVQDDQLLDSPPCIRFLLKLLNPPPQIVEGKAPSIGSKLLGTYKRQVLTVSNKGTDSSSRAIISKVQEILLNCKEIKSSSEDDREKERPELSSKWIALLTMEKACLSAVSFEDTSHNMRNSEANFKERLRKLGGLDAIFDVVINCHSTMEGWFKDSLASLSELKDGVAFQSVVLLLKCLKIMENATFLSKDNQDHLLGMKKKLNSKGLPLSFVEIVLSAIKLFSGISVRRSSSAVSNNGKSNCLSKSVGSCFSAPEARPNGSQNGIQIGSSSTDDSGGCDNENVHVKNINICHKRQRLSASPLEVSVSVINTAVASGSDVCSIEERDSCSQSVSCNGVLSGSNGESCIQANGLKSKKKSNDLKLNSSSGSNGLLPVRANFSKTNSGNVSKGPHMSEADPFAFDEDDSAPSKWELLAKKTETPQAHRSTVIDSELAYGRERSITSIDEELTQSNEEVQLPLESACPSSAEDSDLLEDCLLTAVKVLMNLTNDNPLGCQQIAGCGGLDTMASLIVSHFPSFDLQIRLPNKSEENISSSNQIMDAGQLNNKHLSGPELDFLVAILGLLVNLVEKDSQNRSRLASASILVERPGRSDSKENCRDVIAILCSIFLTNQGAGEAAGEGKILVCDEASLLQGEREAEMMIIEAYSALLLAFLSTESTRVREAIARCLPNQNLQVLVPVLERFVEFHLTLNMISPETHSTVVKVIESCKGH